MLFCAAQCIKRVAQPQRVCWLFLVGCFFWGAREGEKTRRAVERDLALRLLPLFIFLSLVASFPFRLILNTMMDWMGWDGGYG
jgi:hypothetical protein